MTALIQEKCKQWHVILKTDLNETCFSFFIIFFFFGRLWHLTLFFLYNFQCSKLRNFLISLCGVFLNKFYWHMTTIHTHTYTHTSSCTSKSKKIIKLMVCLPVWNGNGISSIKSNVCTLLSREWWCGDACLDDDIFGLPCNLHVFILSVSMSLFA